MQLLETKTSNTILKYRDGVDIKIICLVEELEGNTVRPTEKVAWVHLQE